MDVAFLTATHSYHCTYCREKKNGGFAKYSGKVNYLRKACWEGANCAVHCGQGNFPHLSENFVRGITMRRRYQRKKHPGISEGLKGSERQRETGINRIEYRKRIE